MYRGWKSAFLATAIFVSWLLTSSHVQADHWRYRPRGTVVGFSIGVGTPTVVYPAPVVVYDPFAPVVVRPAPVVIVDPWCPHPVPVYYRGTATGVYIGPGFGFYYERWR